MSASELQQSSHQFLKILDQQSAVSRGDNTKRNTFVGIHDKVHERLAASVSTQLPASDLTLDHVLNLKTGVLYMGIFETDPISERPKPVVRNKENISAASFKNGTIDIQSVFGKDTVIVGIKDDIITVLSGNRVRTISLKTLRELKKGKVNEQEGRELLRQIATKITGIRAGLIMKAQVAPMKIRVPKGGDNHKYADL